jgi:ubiquinone/menaquinone biosynthesis C-methylase UbiE
MMRQVSVSPPPEGSLRERDNKFYEILAGGARLKLLEAFLELGIGEAIGGCRAGEMKASAIIEAFALHPHRGWKFLHSLALVGILTEVDGVYGSENATYRLSDDTKEYFGADGKGGYFFRELVSFQKYLTTDIDIPFVDVIKGEKLPKAMVKWPPQTALAAKHLETWMTVTAEGAIATIMASGCMEGAAHLLDIGGGDGTIALAVVDAYKSQNMKATVFNLEASADLARDNIEDHHASHKVDVVVGDFLQGKLPQNENYDRVMFSRVLTDWDATTCRMLLQKAKDVLLKTKRESGRDGKLIINEAFMEGNADYCTAWEFRYIFYDTFGRAVYKSVDTYASILKEVGFEVVAVSPMLDSAFYSVITAQLSAEA